MHGHDLRVLACRSISRCLSDRCASILESSCDDVHCPLVSREDSNGIRGNSVIEPGAYSRGGAVELVRERRYPDELRGRSAARRAVAGGLGNDVVQVDMLGAFE